jgi:hypothetical protein
VRAYMRGSGYGFLSVAEALVHAYKQAHFRCSSQER